MATETAIAIRKAEAQERIAAAVSKLGAEMLGIDLAPAHKEPAIAQAMQLEAIADALEWIAGAGAPTKATDADAALAQGEATALAEKLEIMAPKPPLSYSTRAGGAKK